MFCSSNGVLRGEASKSNNQPSLEHLVKGSVSQLRSTATGGVVFPIDRLDAEELGYYQVFGRSVSAITALCYSILWDYSKADTFRSLDDPAEAERIASGVDIAVSQLGSACREYAESAQHVLPPARFVELNEAFFALNRHLRTNGRPIDARPVILRAYKSANLLNTSCSVQQCSRTTTQRLRSTCISNRLTFR
jgi:hypothetical protein